MASDIGSGGDSVIGALVRRQGVSSPAFAQTGTVDWVEFVKSTVSFSVETLARLSNGRLDAYTILVGQALSSSFRVEQEARGRLSSAVKELGAYKGFGDMLWYGFGISNPIRRLAVSEEGMLLCGLCGALSECYEKAYCAEVLNEMTRTMSAPGDLTPSLLQWEELAGLCSGFLARTVFPNLVDGFIRLSDTKMQRPFRVPRALDMADTLLAIASITRGEIQSITIKGNHHAGFIAAVAEWLLSLNILHSSAMLK
ncbi:hypothetical protein ABW20_dc0108884 [Dactylellina cionopaga]|nr:hypothetical protein ABW20_dc0108884 [Dactylellina cionopaga]